MNKRFSSVAFLFVFFTTFLQAQKEFTFNWHFGQGQALNFSSGGPVIVSGSAIETFEGSAAISDANGQLLFYTNGGGRDPILSGQTSGKIWNRLNEVMYDMGNTQGGGFSAAQSSVIVPAPGKAGKYVLFTMEEVEFDIGGMVLSQPGGRGLSYFVVDMALNGGLGGVESYTPSVYVPTYEGLCAVRHSNGQDYWIIINQSNNKGLAVFELTAAGLSSPKLFSFGSAETGGMIKASPDGKHVTVPVNGGRLLLNFDASLGTLTNPQPLSDGVYAEFSPNSRYLYVNSFSNSREILRYDLKSPDINNSLTLLGTLPADIGTGIYVFTSQFLLAPDRNIYFYSKYIGGSGGYTTLLSAITCANAGGNLKANFLKIPANTPDDVAVGLPNFPSQWLADNAVDAITVNLGNDTTLCPGQSVTLNAGNFPGATYSWNNNTGTSAITPSLPGIYSVTVSTGCALGVDSIEIKTANVSANAGPDLSVCPGAGIQLQSQANGVVSWLPSEGLSSNSSTAPVARPEKTTLYVLTARLGECVDTDTVLLSVLPGAAAGLIPTDTTLIPGTSVQLQASGGTSYKWLPTAGLSCSDCPNPVAQPTQTTTYIVTVTDAQGCTDTASITITIDPELCKLQMPNAFSPNGDNNNDIFAPEIRAPQAEYDMAVYNRWGDKVFDTLLDNSKTWDGNVNGKPAPADVYVFYISGKLCGRAEQLSGPVTLLR